jgi:hypothetical protein
LKADQRLGRAPNEMDPALLGETEMDAMKAARVHEYGGPEVPKIRDRSRQRRQPETIDQANQR